MGGPRSARQLKPEVLLQEAVLWHCWDEARPSKVARWQGTRHERHTPGITLRKAIHLPPYPPVPQCFDPPEACSYDVEV